MTDATAPVRLENQSEGTPVCEADIPDTVGTELPPVAAAEARAAAPAQVRSIDAVARSRLLTVGPDALLAEVAALLSAAQISLVVVCDASGAIAGVITETTLVRQLGSKQAAMFATRAGDVMTREFTVCTRADSLSEVLAMMHDQGIIHVAIVDDANRPLGIVNARDGLRALLAAGNHEEALLRNYVMGIGYTHQHPHREPPCSIHAKASKYPMSPLRSGSVGNPGP